MAEFLNPANQRQKVKPGKASSGFNAMGKPIPLYRKQAAYEHCKMMGMTDQTQITACVGGMSEKLERDAPYEAMEVGMRYVDLVGCYRLFAVLLTAEKG